jgi:hypothetical protein
MLPQAARRVANDPHVACREAGLDLASAPDLDAPTHAVRTGLAIVDGWWPTRALHPAILAAALAAGHRPPPPPYGDVVWFASALLDPEPGWRDGGVVAMNVRCGAAMLVGMRARAADIYRTRMMDRIAHWLCAESDDPEVRRAVDNWIVAVKLVTNGRYA